LERKRIVDAVVSRHEAIALKTFEAVCEANGIEVVEGKANIPLGLASTVFPQMSNNFTSEMLIDVLTELLADD